jgi:hypothetical protein
VSEEQTQMVRELVREKRFDEARAILLNLKHDPIAREWLDTLNTVMAREYTPSKSGFSQKQRWATDRLVINLVVAASLFIIFRNILPGIIYWLYDWRFRKNRHLNLNRVVIGVCAALGVYFGLYVLLIVLPYI